MATASEPTIVLTLKLFNMKLIKFVFGLFVLSILFTACTNDDIAENDALFIEQDLLGDGGGKSKPPPPGGGGWEPIRLIILKKP